MVATLIEAFGSTFSNESNESSSSNESNESSSSPKCNNNLGQYVAGEQDGNCGDKNYNVLDKDNCNKYYAQDLSGKYKNCYYNVSDDYGGCNVGDCTGDNYPIGSERVCEQPCIPSSK
jgi:hypothetical protein